MAPCPKRSRARKAFALASVCALELGGPAAAPLAAATAQARGGGRAANVVSAVVPAPAAPDLPRRSGAAGTFDGGASPVPVKLGAEAKPDAAAAQAQGPALQVPASTFTFAGGAAPAKRPAPEYAKTGKPSALAQLWAAASVSGPAPVAMPGSAPRQAALPEPHAALVGAPPQPALSPEDEDKLAQGRDLANPDEQSQRLLELRRLLDSYKGSLVDRSGDAPAVGDDLSLRQASDAALKDQLSRFGQGSGDTAPAQPADTAVVKRIDELVAKIESLRGEASADMAERDAVRQLLAVADRARGAALRDRRSGKEMLTFHENLSRLDSVMSIALSLNEINAAQKAITDMLALVDAKLAKINASSAQNQQNLQQAQQNQQQLQQWKDQAAATLKSDKDTQQTIVDDEGEAAMALDRVGAFQRDVAALIAAINARDGAGKGDALKEYQRRIDLLPTVVQWRTSGNPSDPSAFSLKGFQDDLAQVDSYLKQAHDGLTQLPTIPVEFAGAVVLLVPGPAVNVKNPSKAQALQILSDRKAYWSAQQAVYKKDLDSISAMMDPSNTSTSVDEFGDAAPKSLPRWRAQQSGIESAAQAAVRQYTAQIDAAAAQVNGVAGSNLPPLSGLSLAQLKDAILKYGDSVRAVNIPDSDSSVAAHQASMNLVTIAKLLPYTADNVVQWAKAGAVVSAIDSAMASTLPAAQAKLGAVVSMFDAVLADVDQDIAFVNGTGGESNQALLDRKLALLRDKILPPLQGARSLIADTLIPYQESSIAQAQPKTGDLYTLFSSQQTLMTTTQKLYGSDVPWAIASFGGSTTDKAGSHGKIAAWRAGIQKQLTGYDDAQGHHEGVNEYVLEIQHRKDPSYTGTEVLYGETQPYSLPKKIAQYMAERSQRVAQLNQQDAQLDEIEGKIEALSKGKYDLRAYRLPVGVTDDAAGVAKVQALVDAKVIPSLADKLKAIGAAENDGGGINLGAGADTPPVGKQPPITLADSQQMALLALDAAKRLVPTSLQQPETAAASFAVARLLYSASVVTAAADALNNQVPAAELFLTHAQKALNDAIASTQKSDAYVDSNGTSETPDQVYARMVGMFAELDAFLKEGIAFFNLKGQWDQSSLNSVDRVGTYYSSLNDIYSGGSSANASELQAAQQMKATLQKTFDQLQATRVKLSGWMAQLNDPTESALRRVSESVSDIQDKTRAVLEANLKWHDLDDQLKRSESILAAKLTQVDGAQQELAALLNDPGVRDQVRDGLPVDLVNRVESLRLSNGAWSIGGAAAPTAIVVRKSQYSAFLDTVLHALQGQASTLNLAAVKQDLLQNPQGLAALLPGSQMMDFGNDADGFYLVYQTQFSVPNGLNTESSVTLGNVARLWGSNVSVTGYQFGSPPNDVNAPYGDKGVDVTVETLQGKNWVNYLDVDFHRFAFDLPPDGSVAANVRASRLLLFDDFAVMLFGDRLYVGLAGFGDFALDKPGANPYYYGGNLKTSLKLTEIMKLNAEQQVLFAKDPRTFFQRVNLDFTGYDPDLNKDWNIVARGDNKDYSRTRLGPSFDIGRLMNSQDSFTLDLFWSRTAGTDDINQQALGLSVLKGFTLRDGQGKPWAVINNRATAEAGQKYDTFTDRLSITFPDSGIVVSGQGKLLGNAKAYYGEISKKLGDNSTVSIGYGSPYVGMNDRLSLMMNTSFTLGQLWKAVIDGSRQELQGGEQLAKFNRSLDDFFGASSQGPDGPQVQELHRVFEQDVARKLISQDIGTLRGEIDELRKAGAFLDNTRVRGMVGFVSSPVSNDEADRASGGGFTAGSETQLTLTKTQKALIEAKSETLFREGLRLQERLLELSKEWQAAVTDIAKAQWDLKLANFMLQNAGSEALRAQARVLVTEAEGRLHQSVLRYNALSGRAPGDPVPFDDLSAADLETLLDSIRRTIAAPDRLYDILGQLDPSEMKKQLGDNPFNVIDWLPIVDKLTVGVGTQLQDMMANQVFTAGVTIRIPVYDPSSKAANHAYQLESRAAIAEMAQAESERALRAQKELEQARLAGLNADAGRPGLKQAAQDLSTAIRAYRNGLLEPSRLQAAFDNWRYYAGSVLDADTTSALAAAWAAADEKVLKPQPADTSVVTIRDLNDAYALVSDRNQSLAEVALRQEAAAEMAQSNDHRIQKAFLDVTVGWGFTASGIGWLPSIGITGIPVTPMLGFVFKPEELRELQVAQGKGQTEYYRRLEKKLEAGLALEFYQNVIAAQTAQGAVDLFDGSLLPQLRGELAAAQGGGDAEAVTTARRKLDEAGARREQAELALRQSEATLNYLLGRPGDAYLRIDLDPKQALASLQKLLRETDPVGNEQGLLKARVDVARAVETMADKDLKSEQLALEPVSLVVRSLGRLIDALGSDHVGNPELAAAARIQTLTEERAQEAYPKQLAAQTSRAFTQLGLVRSELQHLAGKTDPESKLRYQTLSGQELNLIGVLMSLGADPSRPPQAGDFSPLPSSFAELTERLAVAEQSLSAEAPDKPVEVMEPETLSHQAAGFLRYYYANQTLGHAPIDRSFAESWIEVRLKRGDADPETLLKLANLRKERADTLYQLQLAGARAGGEVLAEDFETEVQMLRWSMKATSTPGLVRGSLDEFSRQLRLRLQQRRDEIAALLGLPPSATLEDLMALVPAEASGSADLAALSRGFVERVKALQLDEVKRTLFDGGLPAGLGAEDDLIHQLRADTIAERMSYKGFTPVAAFGLFRGRQIGGLFMEAPDPRDIQRGLQNVLSDTLRKELESSGALQELALSLRELMARVEDGSKELEQHRALVEAAEADYAAQMGKLSDASQAAEVEAARERLVDAWVGFSRQMVRVKSDFIALVEELDALGQDRQTGLSPLPVLGHKDLPALRTAPKDALLSYWTDRLLDPEFRAAFEAQLSGMGSKVPPDLRAALDKELSLYELASRDADAVAARDFTDEEKLDLLARNDKEGKRQALASDLGRLLDLSGGLDAKADPLMAGLLADLDARKEKDSAGVAEYQGLSRASRQAMWEALPAPPEARAAERRAEAARETMDAARQSLLESYLSRDAQTGPESFVMKDKLLDAYLKAQQAYDDSVLAAFQLPCVAADRELAWRLDGLFDLTASALRQMDAARSGRGLLAIDALIMLEESRLKALRWQGRSPEAIDESALALQRLRDKRESWLRGSADLQPLYAVTPVSKDGARQSVVERWTTAAELAAGLKTGLVTEKDGRYFTQTPDGERELVGGVDAAQAKLDRARAGERADDRALDAASRLKDYDLVLDAPLEGGRGGYSVDELYGPGGLQSQGRLFYFERPQPGEPAGRLHKALHPLLALQKSPESYVVFAYTGGLALARDRYPTLESLAASPEAPDFHELTLSARGAQALSERALSQRAAELRSGWIDVKLNSFGFARDPRGDIVELYLTQDDLNAQRKAFANAVPDLALAQKTLADAQAKAAAAKAALQDAQERAQTAGLAFQAVQARRRAALKDDRKLVEDREYKDAQKRFDPFAKAAFKAQDDWKAADAAVTNAQKALSDATLMCQRSKTWSLYVSKDVTLQMDKQGGVVEAAGTPVYGSLRLDDKIPGGPAAFAMQGELLAAALDKDGRVVRYYQDPKAVAADAPTWSLKTVELGEDRTLSAGSTEVAPRYRLAHYEVDGVPVLLSRRFMIERAEAAQKGLDRASNYGILPWNWADLVLELPRGIVDAPVELITGRDPRQQHYLGRVYMYKTEGGLTERHGFFRKALGVIDVLDLLPDPVQRFYDPSQFPDAVKIGSPVLPGQSVFQKDPTTIDGKHDVRYGVGALAGARRESLEDLTAARERTLSRFHGGVQTTLLETVRGRNGPYIGSEVLASSGRKAIEDALRDPVIASDPRSDGSGTVVSSQDPGNIAVDRVEKRVTVTAGADQLQQQSEALAGYSDLLAQRLEALRNDRASLEEQASDAQRMFDGTTRRRELAHAVAGRGSLPAPAPVGGTKPSPKQDDAPASGRAPAQPARTKLDYEWWQRFLAGLGLLALLGGAFAISGEKKPEPA